MSKRARVRRRWKAVERAVAKYWGMKRAHFERHDTHGHPIITVEVKSREKPPATVRKWMEQAIAETPTGKVPVVQLHTIGEEYDNDIVFIRAADLRDIIGQGRYAE